MTTQALIGYDVNELLFLITNTNVYTTQQSHQNMCTSNGTLLVLMKLSFDKTKYKAGLANS